jgi:hypothetical protein
VALWQPFVTDYRRRLELSHGLPLWWYSHPTAVGWLHLGWAAAAVLVVVGAPATWLASRSREAVDAAAGP